MIAEEADTLPVERTSAERLDGREGGMTPRTYGNGLLESPIIGIEPARRSRFGGRRPGDGQAVGDAVGRRLLTAGIGAQ